MKKQLEETISESKKQLPFSSLQSEVEYLREENRTKSIIIKQLTENKAMTCSCNEVSTSGIMPIKTIMNLQIVYKIMKN